MTELEPTQPHLLLHPNPVSLIAPSAAPALWNTKLASNLRDKAFWQDCRGRPESRLWQMRCAILSPLLMKQLDQIIFTAVLYSQLLLPVATLSPPPFSSYCPHSCCACVLVHILLQDTLPSTGWIAPMYRITRVKKLRVYCWTWWNPYTLT